MAKQDTKGRTKAHQNDEQKSDASIPPEDNTYQLPQPIGTTRELISDRTQLATVQHDDLTQFVNESVGQRSQFLRDTLAISIAVLVGAFTVYFTNTDTSLIKSPWLFLVALAVITGAALGNLWARAEILKHQQDVSYRIQDDHIKVFEAARNYLLTPTQQNLDALNATEGNTVPYPNLKTIGAKGHTYVTWLMSVGVVGLAVSLVLKITL